MIPILPSSKIDPNTTFAKSMINTDEEWPLADIPNLPATKITTGTFAKSMITTGDGSQWAAADIPDLSATKITSDTLNATRIPNLDAAKITTGTISSDRLPATTSECLMFKAVGARYGGSPNQKTIGTSLALLDSHLSGSFTSPASGIVTVSLKFYVSAGSGSTHWIAAQLIIASVRDAQHHSACAVRSTLVVYSG